MDQVRRSHPCFHRTLLPIQCPGKTRCDVANFWFRTLEQHMRIASKTKAAKPASAKPASAKPKRRGAGRPPPAARPYHHGDLRRVLIDAASQLAEEGGAEAVSVREAARRAGVSPGAPFRHFPSRDALMLAVAE